MVFVTANRLIYNRHERVKIILFLNAIEWIEPISGTEYSLVMLKSGQVLEMEHPPEYFISPEGDT